MTTSYVRRALATFTVLGGLLGPPPPAAAAPAEPQCGVDLAAPQIAEAVTRLRPPFPDFDGHWDSVAYDGNFDPCAMLSTALVTVERATGSSPDHAMFFHYGRYLGTATWLAYPFTSLNRAQTTDDTVVLDYKVLGEECTACAAPVHTVRYLWTGDHVEMLDPPPESGTG